MHGSQARGGNIAAYFCQQGVALLLCRPDDCVCMEQLLNMPSSPLHGIDLVTGHELLMLSHLAS